MRAAGSLRPVDGGGGAGGGVGSVNGKTGAVVLDGTDLAYTPFYAGTTSAATTIAGQIKHIETHVGTADVVWDEDTLAAAAPLAGSTYPITGPGLWTPPLGGAPLSLTAGRDVTLSNPGSIDGLGGSRVALIGDVAGKALLSGEVQARSLTVGNVNPGGSDMQAESLGGRTLVNNSLFLVGGNAGVIENVPTSTWTSMGVIAPFPGAVGLSIDNSIGNLFFGSCVVAPPGGAPHVGFTLEPTAIVTAVLDWAVVGYVTQDAGDALIHIDPAATVPTGAIPTSTIGIAVTGVAKTGPGSLFTATGRGEDDIRVFSSGHLSAASSRYIGDALYDVSLTAGAPDASLTHVGIAPTVDVVPSDNVSGGGVGATIVTLALDAISQRFTLVNPSPQLWYMRYDGAPGDLRGVVIWRAQVLKGGGASATVQGFVQESVGGGAFVTIPQTSSITRGLVNNIPGEVSGQAPVTLSPDHRYRIVMSTTDIAIPTLIRSLTIEIGGSP